MACGNGDDGGRDGDGGDDGAALVVRRKVDGPLSTQLLDFAAVHPGGWTKVDGEWREGGDEADAVLLPSLSQAAVCSPAG